MSFGDVIDSTMLFHLVRALANSTAMDPGYPLHRVSISARAPFFARTPQFFQTDVPVCLRTPQAKELNGAAFPWIHDTVRS